jgi:hypothetical protein
VASFLFHTAAFTLWLIFFDSSTSSSVIQFETVFSKLYLSKELLAENAHKTSAIRHLYVLPQNLKQHLLNASNKLS